MNEIIFDTFYGSDGRLKVILKNADGIEEECDLAGLVARTFLPHAPKDLNVLPKFKDGNVRNCSKENLFWEK